jgi:predicted dehydrogenase
MPTTLKWGILGTGGIAGSFARDLGHVGDAELVAVGSRTNEAAQRFADQFGVPRAYGSYQALVDDPQVDVVYVATPQSIHADCMRLAIKAGRAVLCEKPFTLTGTEAREIVKLARDRGVFLMEAMWTRYLPHMQRINDLLRVGALGDLTTLVADHGQHIPKSDGHRLHRPDLGGGALLDLGVYPISLASHIFGPPSTVTAVGQIAPHGVDLQTSIVLTYDTGAHAVLTTTLNAGTANRATITGTEARIDIDDVWYAPTSFSLVTRGAAEPDRFQHCPVGTGLWYQAQAVGDLLRAAETESPLMPLDETVTIMETMDSIRDQIGLTYSHMALS